jgi:hypothetical protein
MTGDEIENLYLEHTSSLVEKSTINANEIFQLLKDSPLDHELKAKFLFYYKELKENIHHDLEPCFVFFVNDRRINAFAKKEKNGTNIIGINVGIFGHLHDVFKNDQDLQTILKNRFPKIPAIDLMFETSAHFTFYHELGHLIQWSSQHTNRFSEECKQEFSLKRHLLEYDADQFASIVIAGHIASFTIDNLGNKVSQNDMESILTSVCTAILFYLLSFPCSRKELYFEEYSHPHPTIRIINIVFDVLNHYLTTLKSYEVYTEINPDNIVLETIKLAKDIYVDPESQTKFNDMQKSIADNQVEINEYLDYLRQLKEGDSSMSTYKWNKFAETSLKKDVHNSK